MTESGLEIRLGPKKRRAWSTDKIPEGRKKCNGNLASSFYPAKIPNDVGSWDKSFPYSYLNLIGLPMDLPNIYYLVDIRSTKLIVGVTPFLL